MSLCFALSFEHLGAMSASNQNFAAAFANLPVSTYNQPGSVIPSIVAGGWLTSSSAVAIVLGITKTAQWVAPDSKKSWFGVRVKLNAGTVVLTTVLLQLGKTNYVLNDPVIDLFKVSDLVAVASAFAGKEFYLEIGIDWVNGIIERRVNTTPIANLSIEAWPQALKDGMTARALGIYTVLSNTGTAYNVGTRDYYLVDNKDDSSIRGPLGAIRLALAENTVVTPTPWTSSNGNVQGVLNTVIGGGGTDLTVPTMNGVANTPLEIGLKLPTAVGLDAVRATVTYISAGLSTGVGADLTASLKNGSSIANGKTMALTSAIKQGVLLSIGEKSPDGTAWTKEKLESTKLVLNCT